MKISHHIWQYGLRLRNKGNINNYVIFYCGYSYLYRYYGVYSYVYSKVAFAIGKESNLCADACNFTSSATAAAHDDADDQ